MAGEKTSNPIRFGILGCADIARKLIRAIGLVPNAAVVAVSVGSHSLDKARRFVVDNRLDAAAVRAHASYEGVLDDPGVDAVYIPLPTSLHVQWATAAAQRRKHVLLEKPTALCAADLDRILEACRSNGVQFMDGTLWMHHPRTAEMRELLSDSALFGPIKSIHSHFSFCADSDFLQNDIRVKPGLDGLGSPGDAGWYCIRSILWAADYELPKTAIALHSSVKNEAGVLLSCSSSLIWEDGKLATFHCSFLSQLTMELCVVGTKGNIQLGDFVIPFEENSAQFASSPGSCFTELVTELKPLPVKHIVTTELPQEALMVQEFSRLVSSIRDSGEKPNEKWPAISRKTQLVLDAVKASLDKGCQPADIVA